jgi:hypothetical protein
MMSEQTPLPHIHSASQPPSLERIQLGIVMALFGFATLTIGSKPEWLGLDRSPVVGFVQISVFTIGIGILCLGGYIGLNHLWGRQEKTILADFGLRIIATGYVIVVFTGMADIFGLGTHSLPTVPFFGPWQALGVQIGQVIIVIGFLMLIPYQLFETRGKAQ